MNWRDDVIKEAITWERTPHVHEAMIKGIGVDCARILISVYEETGVMPKGQCQPPHYPRDFHLHKEPKYLEWVLKYCDKVEEALPGDIVVFHFGRGISHGGIVLKWPVIIHAYVGMGVIRSNINESFLLDKKGESRLRGIYRPKGCE